jgi:mRNA-degrading endonuclease YafQ of YafQ-DinJ toxin-antitoxin module
MIEKSNRHKNPKSNGNNSITERRKREEISLGEELKNEAKLIAKRIPSDKDNRNHQLADGRQWHGSRENELE